MKCPVCKTEELDFSPLESNLTSRHCDQCGGNWIPSFELIFTAPWQDQVRSQESRRAQEELYRKKFGAEDFNEIQRIKVWINGHPRKQEILAYLMSDRGTERQRDRGTERRRDGEQE